MAKRFGSGMDRKPKNTEIFHGKKRDKNPKGGSVRRGGYLEDFSQVEKRQEIKEDNNLAGDLPIPTVQSIEEKVFKMRLRSINRCLDKALESYSGKKPSAEAFLNLVEDDFRSIDRGMPKPATKAGDSFLERYCAFRAGLECLIEGIGFGGSHYNDKYARILEQTTNYPMAGSRTERSCHTTSHYCGHRSQAPKETRSRYQNKVFGSPDDEGDFIRKATTNLEWFKSWASEDAELRSLSLDAFVSLIKYASFSNEERREFDIYLIKGKGDGKYRGNENFRGAFVPMRDCLKGITNYQILAEKVYSEIVDF